MKIEIKIGEKEIKIGKLDLSCDDCSKDIRALMERVDIDKIWLYKVVTHGKVEWHVEVL